MKWLLLCICLVMGNLTYSQQAYSNEYGCMNNGQGDEPDPIPEDSIKVYFERLVGFLQAYKSVEKVTKINIPVVYHVVWNEDNPDQNVSDDILITQLEALNRDFNAMNGDWTKIPKEYQHLMASMEINFCLAQEDPKGRRTRGITRTQTEVRQFWVTDEVKKTKSGGKDPWDPARYLNIWVTNLNDFYGLLGYAQFPNGGVSTDGVVIDYACTGYGEPHVSPKYSLGRVLAHEIGHWLNLHHAWLDVEENEWGVNVTQILNIMDYGSDDCMVMFTNRQKIRAYASLWLHRQKMIKSNIKVKCDIRGRYEPNYWPPIFLSIRKTFGGNILVITKSCRMPGLSKVLIFKDDGGIEYTTHGNLTENMMVDLTGVKPGNYTLIVYDHEGNRVHEERITVENFKYNLIKPTEEVKDSIVNDVNIR